MNRVRREPQELSVGSEIRGAHQIREEHCALVRRGTAVHRRGSRGIVVLRIEQQEGGTLHYYRHVEGDAELDRLALSVLSVGGVGAQRDRRGRGGIDHHRLRNAQVREGQRGVDRRDVSIDDLRVVKNQCDGAQNVQISSQRAVANLDNIAEDQRFRLTGAADKVGEGGLRSRVALGDIQLKVGGVLRSARIDKRRRTWHHDPNIDPESHHDVHYFPGPVAPVCQLDSEVPNCGLRGVGRVHEQVLKSH